VRTGQPQRRHRGPLLLRPGQELHARDVDAPIAPSSDAKKKKQYFFFDRLFDDDHRDRRTTRQTKDTQTRAASTRVDARTVLYIQSTICVDEATNTTAFLFSKTI
jgi:hypothetical protein